MIFDDPAYVDIPVGAIQKAMHAEIHKIADAVAKVMSNLDLLRVAR